MDDDIDLHAYLSVCTPQFISAGSIRLESLALSLHVTCRVACCVNALAGTRMALRPQSWSVMVRYLRAFMQSFRGKGTSYISAKYLNDSNLHVIFAREKIS